MSTEEYVHNTAPIALHRKALARKEGIRHSPHIKCAPLRNILKPLRSLCCCVLVASIRWSAGSLPGNVGGGGGRYTECRMPPPLRGTACMSRWMLDGMVKPNALLVLRWHLRRRQRLQ